MVARCIGRPRSITEDSDILRLCIEAWAPAESCFSARGEFLGEAARKKFDATEEGVGSSAPVFGERRTSDAPRGVTPPDEADAGVASSVLLDLELSWRGAGDPLRSMAGDLGGTSGGSAESTVFNFNDGLAPGLRIGDRGRPAEPGDS